MGFSRQGGAGFTWEPLGPYGGEARRLAVDSRHPEVCYVGTGDGQLYRSTNGGWSWQLLQPGLPARGFSIESLVIDTQDSSRLYVAGWFVRGRPGGGVYVSDDGGQTWSSLPGLEGRAVRALVQRASRPHSLLAGALDGVYETEDGGATWRRLAPDHPELKNVRSLAVDPSDPRVIYVGTWHLPWKTTDGGRTWEQIGNSSVGMVDDSDIFSILIDGQNPSRITMSACTGLYRSDNGGLTWNKIQGIPTTSRRTHVIRQHPNTPSTLYAGTTQGLWRSTDAGRHWQLVTDRNLVIYDIAFPLSVVSSPLSVAKDEGQPTHTEPRTTDYGPRTTSVLLATNQGIFRSENEAAFLASNDGFSHVAVASLRIDREDPARLLLGLYARNGRGGFRSLVLNPRSVVSGRGSVAKDKATVQEQETTDQRPRGLADRGLPGVDVHCIWQLPQSPDVIYAGTSQGLYRSGDRGRQWRVVPGPWSLVSGKEDKRQRTPGQRLTKGPETKDEGQGTRNNSSAKILALVPTGRPGEALLLTETALYLAELESEVCSELYRSQGGERLMCVAVGRPEAGVNGSMRISDFGFRISDFSFNSQFAIRNSQFLTIYLGSNQGLRISRDAGRTWAGVLVDNQDYPVQAVAEGAGGVVYVGTAVGLFRLRWQAGVANWSRCGSGLPPISISAIAINPRQAGELIVGDQRHGGLYQSLDDGEHWQRIDSGFASARVSALTFDHRPQGRQGPSFTWLYVGTLHGGSYVGRRKVFESVPPAAGEGQR